MTEIKPGTPLPWSVTVDRARVYSANRTEWVVADAAPLNGCWKHTEANAAYIVHTANAYPSLLNGLREARETLEEAAFTLGAIHCAHEADPMESPAWQRARTVIAKLNTLLSQEGGQ